MVLRERFAIALVCSSIVGMLLMNILSTRGFRKVSFQGLGKLEDCRAGSLLDREDKYVNHFNREEETTLRMLC